MDFRSRTDLLPGLRNNNPGNIKYDGTSWQGAVGNDGTFVIFADDTWGLRALAKDLTTKMTKDGLDTISKIISVYAPPGENNTAAYIAAVQEDTGFDSDQTLTADQGTLHSLIRAIANHENGDTQSALISDDDIDQGITMASNTIASAAQAAVVAVSNNTDGSALIFVGVLLLGFYLIKST